VGAHSASLQRNYVWPRFEARAGRHPDPFGQPLWTLIQVLLWVSFRNRDLVRDASPPEPFESTFTIMDLRDLARNGAYYPRIANPGEALIEALRAGRVTASGVANGTGDRKEIPSLLWVDLEFRYEPLDLRTSLALLLIGMTCGFSGGTCWRSGRSLANRSGWRTNQLRSRLKEAAPPTNLSQSARRRIYSSAQTHAQE
jgi:hypothetical protein